MLIADISHHNGVIDWAKTGLDVVIIKATEGISFKDPMYEKNKSGARKAGILCGHYHFATSQNPALEADWFIKTVGSIQEGELLALDAETGQSPQWCKEFLDRVTEKVGFRPLIYCLAGNGMDWAPVVKGNYGLWIPRWYMNTGYLGLLRPSSFKWPFWVLWQYTSRGKITGIKGFVDLNYTTCSLVTLEKYGKQNNLVECPKCHFKFSL